MTDIWQFFQASCPECSYLLAVQINYEAGLFFKFDQNDFKPIVKQMLVILDGNVPEDLGVVILYYFFWFYPPVISVLKIVLST